MYARSIVLVVLPLHKNFLRFLTITSGPLKAWKKLSENVTRKIRVVLGIKMTAVESWFRRTMGGLDWSHLLPVRAGKLLFCQFFGLCTPFCLSREPPSGRRMIPECASPRALSDAPKFCGIRPFDCSYQAKNSLIPHPIQRKNAGFTQQRFNRAGRNWYQNVALVESYTMVPGLVGFVPMAVRTKRKRGLI